MRVSLQKRLPTVSITLDQEPDHLNRPYSDGELIQGSVLLDDCSDINIEDVSIAFVGRCTSVVTNEFPWAHASQSMKTTHTFLTMQQPWNRPTLSPTQQEFLKSMYRIPFSFTFPSELLPHACEHKSDPNSYPIFSRAEASLHLRPPPSFNTNLAGKATDDLANEKACVQYAVFASLRVKRGGEERIHRLDARLPVFVEPCATADAPSGISKPCGSAILPEAYLLRDLFWRQSRSGQLSLQAIPPSPILSTRMWADVSLPLTTVKTILGFTPWQSEAQPPQIGYVRVALRARTKFATMQSTKLSSLQSSTKSNSQYSVQSALTGLRCYYAPSLNWRDCSKDSRSVADNFLVVNGEEDVVSGLQAHPPEYDEMPEACISQHPTYQATLSILIMPPQSRKCRDKLKLVPTFESCIVGRSYSLEITLSFRHSSVELTQLKHEVCEVDSNRQCSGLVHHVDDRSQTPKMMPKVRTKQVKLEIPIQVVPNPYLSSSQGGTQTVYSTGHNYLGQQSKTATSGSYSQLTLSNPSAENTIRKSSLDEAPSNVLPPYDSVR